MKIRYAKPADLKFIVNGMREIVSIEEDSVWIEKFLVRSDREKKARRAISEKNIFVATAGGKPIGFIWFSISKKCPYGLSYGNYTKKFVWINFSYVSKKFRSRGIGKKLYKEVFKLAARKKIRTVVLDVFTINKRSLKFHKRLGFRPKIHLLFRER